MEQETIKITLKAARVNAGLTILEASKLLGFGKDTLIKYEKNPEQIRISVRRKFSEVYRLPADHIFFGKH